jgi:hypothetical protein
MENNQNNKIAFCFLTYSDLDKSNIWQSYLQPNLDKCNIYIHPKTPLKNSFFKQFVLPSKFITKTYKKSDILIVYATLLLINFAIMKSENKKIIFLSQSCFPIVSFDELYINLMKDNNEYSYIKTFNNNKKDRYFKLDSKFKNILSYEKFTKQHPNMILDRNHAIYFINKIEYLNLFKYIECPDEHYFINIINAFFTKSELDKIKNIQICFCNFNLNNTQAINHKIITKELLNNLKNAGYLFIRKITPKCLIYL